MVVMPLVVAVLFMLLRISARNPIGQVVLHPLAGITTLIAVPGFWFYIVEITRPGPELHETFWGTYGVFFALEMSVAGAVLYLEKTVDLVGRSRLHSPLYHLGLRHGEPFRCAQLCFHCILTCFSLVGDPCGSGTRQCSVAQEVQ